MLNNYNNNGDFPKGSGNDRIRNRTLQNLSRWRKTNPGGTTEAMKIYCNHIEFRWENALFENMSHSGTPTRDGFTRKVPGNERIGTGFEIPENLSSQL